MEIKSKKYELCVIDGPQQGSRQPLRLARVHTVGNSLDSDIYLHDDSEDIQQVEILPGKSSLSITLRSGSAVLDSTTMAKNKKYLFEAGTLVRIGESLFVVENTSKNNAADTESVPLEEIKDPDPIGASSAPPRAKKSLLNRPLVLVTFIGLGIAGSVVAAWQADPWEKQIVLVAEPESIQELIDQTIDSDVSVSSVDGSSFFVKGILASPEEERILRNVLSQRSETITFDIAITTDIEESVRDVFRQHRIDVTLKSLSPGRLVVRTKTADIDSLESAEAAALADVYGLAEINVVNEKPFPKTPVINNRTLVSMPGQEIRLIMVGNPSYVVTEDQSHFFAGSKLPTGHRIKSIEKDKVILDKQGEITELLM